jgi:hypothetical protein
MDLPPPQPETLAFEASETQVRVGVGTTPRVRGKGGAAIWATGLWSTELVVHRGLVEFGPMTLSAGLGAAFGRPYVVEGFSARMVESRVRWADLDLAAWHWGARGIATLHMSPNPDGRWHPYAQWSVGPQRMGLSAVYDGVLVDGEALYTLTSWQAEHGIGVDVVLGQRSLLSVEGTYSLGMNAQKESSAALTVKEWELLQTASGKRTAAPRGWTLSVAFGRRFG